MGVVENPKKLLLYYRKLLEWMETMTAQPRGGDERAGLEVSLMVYDLKGECNSMAFPDRWAARVDALVALVNACASPCGGGRWAPWGALLGPMGPSQATIMVPYGSP